jgi:hypothetical protein
MKSIILHYSEEELVLLNKKEFLKDIFKHPTIDSIIKLVLINNCIDLNKWMDNGDIDLNYFNPYSLPEGADYNPYNTVFRDDSGKYFRVNEEDE